MRDENCFKKCVRSYLNSPLQYLFVTTSFCRAHHLIPKISLFLSQHAFFECVQSHNVGAWILDCVGLWVPNASVEDILTLNLDTSEAITWIIIESLSYIWTRRSANKTAILDECKASLQDKANVLHSTSKYDIASMIDQLIQM